MSHKFPIGASVRLSQQNINPYPIFERLRESEPVSWIDEIGMWYVTRREDVLRILANPEGFTVVSSHSLIHEALGHNMLTTDGDEQYRLRSPFIHSFAPHAVKQNVSEMLTALSHQLIDDFATDGFVDLKPDFADLIAIFTVAQILGLQINDPERVRGWVQTMNQVMSNFAGDEAIRQAGVASRQDFADFVLASLANQPPESSMLARLAHQGSLSDDELVDAARVIVFGGVETTSAMMTNTLWALLQHPNQLASVRKDIDLLPNAIEEALRWESPVQTCTRHLTQSIEVQGVMMEQGQSLQCMLGAANRDPAYFADADRFDITRPNAKDHLAFAHGKHYCIGAGLARLEAQIGLRTLLERLPHIRLFDAVADAPQGYEFRSSPQLRLQWLT